MILNMDSISSWSVSMADMLQSTLEDRSGETSKFTTESHKMIQGDVGELFL